MAYDLASYQADRAMMGFDDQLVMVTEHGLKLRRARLALKKDRINQAAVDAAHARLLAWRKSGAAEPGLERNGPPEDEPFSDSEPPSHRGSKRPLKRGRTEEAARNAKRLEDDKAGWALAMAGRQERHGRRRSAYSKVRPIDP